MDVKFLWLCPPDIDTRTWYCRQDVFINLMLLAWLAKIEWSLPSCRSAVAVKTWSYWRPCCCEYTFVRMWFCCEDILVVMQLLTWRTTITKSLLSWRTTTMKSLLSCRTTEDAVVKNYPNEGPLAWITTIITLLCRTIVMQMLFWITTRLRYRPLLLGSTSY